MIYWPAKAPGAVLDFAFDFSDALQQGEAIAAHLVTANGVVKNSDSESGGVVTAVLSGGQAGSPGIVTCSVTTNSVPARTFVETAILPIGEEPVSLTMARAQCRAEGAGDDDYLVELAQSAREHVEAYCGLRLVTAAVQMTFGSFAELERLPQAPLQAVVDVRYLDSSGVEQLLDPAVYEKVNLGADPLRPGLRLAYGKNWPSVRAVDDAVRVNATVGYTVVPKPIVHAMLLLIGHWYDNRGAASVGESTQEIPHGVAALLANYRR